MTSKWPGDVNRDPRIDHAMPSLAADVVEAAQRKVLRDCPDDFEIILDALGIG